MNCTRVVSSGSAAARARTSSVFATPGTPSSSTCPRHSRAMTRPVTAASWPDDGLGDLGADRGQRLARPADLVAGRGRVLRSVRHEVRLALGLHLHRLITHRGSSPRWPPAATSRSSSSSASASRTSPARPGAPRPGAPAARRRRPGRSPRRRGRRRRPAVRRPGTASRRGEPAQRPPCAASRPPGPSPGRAGTAGPGPHASRRRGRRPAAARGPPGPSRRARQSSASTTATASSTTTHPNHGGSRSRERRRARRRRLRAGSGTNQTRSGPCAEQAQRERGVGVVGEVAVAQHVRLPDHDHRGVAAVARAVELRPASRRRGLRGPEADVGATGRRGRVELPRRRGPAPAAASSAAQRGGRVRGAGDVVGAHGRAPARRARLASGSTSTSRDAASRQRPRASARPAARGARRRRCRAARPAGARLGRSVPGDRHPLPAQDLRDRAAAAGPPDVRVEVAAAGARVATAATAAATSAASAIATGRRGAAATAPAHPRSARPGARWSGARHAGPGAPRDDAAGAQLRRRGRAGPRVRSPACGRSP